MMFEGSDRRFRFRGGGLTVGRETELEPEGGIGASVASESDTSLIHFSADFWVTLEEEAMFAGCEVEARPPMTSSNAVEKFDTMP